MKLSSTQIQEFNQNGYHVFGELLNAAEVERLAEIYMDCVENYQSPHASQGIKKIRHSDAADSNPALFYQLRCAHLMHDDFARLVRNTYLLDAIESLLGPNLRIVICQGMYKPPYSGDTINWHQDDYYFRVDKPNAVVSCWLTLDDVTVDNGCMWVIPGAHKSMVEHELVPSGTGYYIPSVEEERAVPIELKRGQCMLHHGLMPHRTLGNTTASYRRALAIHYMDAMARPNQVRQEEPPENMPMVRGTGVCW